MKKFTVILLLMTTTTLAASTTKTNKTALIPRSQCVNLALEYTNGWQHFMYPQYDDLFGGNFQFAFSYEAITNEKKLGRYFSPTGRNVFNFGARYGADQDLTQDLNFRSIIHTPATGALEQTDDETVATMSLRAERQTLVYLFNYHQYLDSLLKGLYIKINMPIVSVENKLHSCIAGETESFLVDEDLVGTIRDPKELLHQYFQGNEININRSHPSFQHRLHHPLIPQYNPCNTICAPGIRKIKMGLADIDISVGYYLLKKKHHHAAINFGFTIPTGNEPDGLYLFDPVYGNGGFWAVGFGLSGHSCLFHCGDHSLSLLSVMNYRYLINHEVPRTLGLCNQKWSQYLLLGQVGKEKLVPAGNILLHNINVKPGSQVDFIVQADYEWKKFNFNIGYNLFYHDEEKLNYNNKCRPIIPENTYAYPSLEYNPYTPGRTKYFGLNNNGTQRNSDFADQITPTFLSSCDVDLSVATTPALLSHKFYGGFSYQSRVCKLPVLIGVGGDYEFGECNQNLNTWAINAKGAIAF